jgi:2,5-diamino-6-(ribosylamino)-4(3H)-pyrimidinone 5'-phosphate reductase
MPKVIMHNSIGLDGSILHFDVNMELHYRIAGKFGADIHFVGSNTVKAGFEMYGGEMPTETKSDYMKPKKDTHLPYWVIPDTRGKLMGTLHSLRNYEFCRDVILLVSKRTTQAYLHYLKERNYDYIVCRDEHVIYEEAFEILSRDFEAKTVLVDAGPTLNGILLEKGLVDEISLLLHPFLVGKKSGKLFERLDLEKKNIKLKLLQCEVIENHYVLLSYKVNS